VITEGAVKAASPAEVARQVDLVFTNLPDSPDVEKVVLGENGIIEGAHPGLILIDNSTIKPAVSRKIAAALAERVCPAWMLQSVAVISARVMARLPLW